MQTTVTPQQRQAAKREIVRQIEQGLSAQQARARSTVLMHRTTVYRLRVSGAARRRERLCRWAAWAPLHFARGGTHLSD
jgi:hypothetical protein